MSKQLENVHVAGENHKLQIQSLVTEWRDKVQTKSACDMDKIVELIKEIEKVSSNFTETVYTNVLSVTTSLYEEKKTMDEIIKQLVAKVQHSNLDVENVCKQVSQNLHSLESSLKKVDLKMHQDIQEQTQKVKEFEEKESKKMQEIEKMFGELKDLQLQRNAIRPNLDAINNKCLNDKTTNYSDFVVQHKNLSQCQEDSGSSAKESILLLTQLQESVVSKTNEQNHKLLEMKETTKNHNDKTVDFVHRSINELNMHRDFYNDNFHQLPRILEESNEKHKKEITGKHETISKLVTDENKRTKSKEIQLVSIVQECLHKSVAVTETKVVESLLKCADDLTTFKHEDLVKYEPSGATPARKDYQFTRNLAATSPHDRLVKKFKLESMNNNDLDSSITILEVSLSCPKFASNLSLSISVFK